MQKKHMSIKSRMLLYILTISAIIYIIAVGYISLQLKNQALTDARDKIDAMSRQYAYYTETELNVDMDMSRTLARTLETFGDKPIGQWKDTQNEILENIIRQNPNFLSVWAIWQLDEIRPGWDKPHGRMRLTYYRAQNQVRYREEVLDTAAGFERGAYYDVMESRQELVMDPYYFSYTGDESNQNYETSVGVPIIKEGRFAGLAGADLSLERFQPVVEKIRPYKGSYAFLISNNGTYIAHPDARKVGEKFQQSGGSFTTEDLLSRIQQGEAFAYTGKDFRDEADHYVSYAPVVVGKSQTPWTFGLSVPVDVVTARAEQTFRNAIIVGIVGLLLVALVIWIIAGNISSPIRRTTAVLGELARGVINRDHKLQVKTNDEVGQMSRSVNTLIDGLDKTALFARQIGQGNLDEKFELLSDDDMLGSSLLEMRESLKEAREKEEERKKEEEKQNWATKGLAKFGDILRQNTDDMHEFAHHILSNLVSYIGAVQGGLYMINDDDGNDRHIEMLACYAYDRRKFIEKRIEMQEGMVGQVIQEGETTYMKKLPDDYVTITSGLGHTPPRSLLIVPLKVNDEIYGAVELASLQPMEDYVISFVEDLAEDIASTIKNTKINLQTNRLLEQSRQQQEELSSQEEEMRQNMEELKATQEEAARRNAEIEGLVGALKRTNMVVEYDLEGKILDVNENYTNLLGLSKEQLVGLHHYDYMDLTQEQKQGYDQFWEDLRQGKTKKETNTIRVKGKSHTFVETYTPIVDQYGNPEKVLKIATDITEVAGKKNT